jgi:hypothetical protein
MPRATFMFSFSFGIYCECTGRYLEISILHCMRFLENEPPKSAFQRLMLMIRGIADPLAAAYVRIYLARKGQSINLQDTGMG